MLAKTGSRSQQTGRTYSMRSLARPRLAAVHRRSPEVRPASGCAQGAEAETLSPPPQTRQRKPRERLVSRFAQGKNLGAPEEGASSLSIISGPETVLRIVFPALTLLANASHRTICNLHFPQTVWVLPRLRPSRADGSPQRKNLALVPAHSGPVLVRRSVSAAPRGLSGSRQRSAHASASVSQKAVVLGLWEALGQAPLGKSRLQARSASGAS